MLLAGYNEGLPRERQLRRVHSYYVLNRDKRAGHKRRYKDCFLERAEGAVPVDVMWD